MNDVIKIGDYVVWNDESFILPYITRNKEYLVIDSASECFEGGNDGIVIISDDGIDDMYRSKFFTTRNKVRNKLIEEILK